MFRASRHPVARATAWDGDGSCCRTWNVWRDAADTMQAWIGDAAMRVEIRADRVVILHGSDGFDTPTFDDLVVALTLR